MYKCLVGLIVFCFSHFSLKWITHTKIWFSFKKCQLSHIRSIYNYLEPPTVFIRIEIDCYQKMIKKKKGSNYFYILLTTSLYLSLVYFIYSTFYQGERMNIRKIFHTQTVKINPSKLAEGFLTIDWVTSIKKNFTFTFYYFFVKLF